MTTAATSRARLLLFGRPKLVDPSGEALHLRPSLWRIVAIVAAGPAEGTTRSRVLGLAWPDGKPGTLRKALWDLREIGRRVGVDLVESAGGALHLSDRVGCDVRDLTAVRPDRDLGQIYRGRLLELADDVDHAAWSAWLEAQRKRFEAIYVAKASALLSRADERRPAQAREALRLLEVDADNETALRAQMLADASAGNLHAAQANYLALRGRLELAGRRPEEQTTDLYFRLRSPGRPREPQPGAAVEEPGIPSVCILRPTGSPRSRGWNLARSLVIDVTIGLCRTSLFRVTAPQTADQIRTPDAARRDPHLRTDYVVTTEVLRHVSGQEQIVFVLYAPASRGIVWSEKIEVSERLSVEAYNILSFGTIRSLVERIDRAELDGFAIRTDPSSYALFLQGQTSLATLDLPSIRRGRQSLTRAYRQTPSFAPTASAMARSFQLEWLLTARGDPDLLESAELYARSAIDTDPYEARGFRELGFCFLYAKDFDRCLEQYERAERLSPHFADILADYADALVHDGQVALALDKIDRAIALNPLCQDTYHWTRGAAQFFLRQYAEAVASIKKMRDRTPALKLLAAAYALQGEMGEASRCRIESMEVYPDMTVEGWSKIVPFRDQRQIQHYLAGLHEAGFK